MKVNFTMLCHGRDRLFKQALNSIGDTSEMAVDIFADDPTFEVHRIAREFIQDKEGSYTAIGKSKGTGGARNSVISAANCHRGDYLYLSDDDVFFKPGWMQTLVNAYEKAWEHGFKVIGAYNHPYHQPIATVPVGDGNVVHEVYALALQSMLMKWEVWDKYGPFRETHPGAVCQGEDCDFGNAIRADGGRLGVIAPALLVNCGITNSFGQPIPGADLVKAQAPEGVIVE